MTPITQCMNANCERNSAGYCGRCYNWVNPAPNAAAPRTPLPPLKWNLHFAGYGKDELVQIEALAREYAQQAAKAERAEAEALLREARDVIDRMTDGPHRADWGDMLDKIDAFLAGGKT